MCSLIAREIHSPPRIPSPAFESTDVSGRLVGRADGLTSRPLARRKHQILRRYSINYILGSFSRPRCSNGRCICLPGAENHVEACTEAFPWYTRSVARKHTQRNLAAAGVPVSLWQSERGK
jgi:hypothetical protein